MVKIHAGVFLCVCVYVWTQWTQFPKADGNQKQSVLSAAIRHI